MRAAARRARRLGPDGAPLGAFRAEGPFPPHELGVRLAGSLPENRSLDVELRLASPDGTVDVVAPFGLYHETGRDSDGFWRETRYATERTLRLPVPREYEVFLMQVDTDASTPPAFAVTASAERVPHRPPRASG